MKLYAKKSLGQHFLNSTHVLEQIIAAATISKGEKVLEIGPGTGVLTTQLLKSGARVIAIEKDSRALEILRTIFFTELQSGQLTLLEGDVLTDTTLQEYLQTPYALIANIPYYITGAILEKFLEYGPHPDRMVLLVQKEVADRIVARDRKESILSISVKAFGTPSIVAKVPPGAFTPPPTVDSAILKIEHINNTHFVENNLNTQGFFTMIRAGFSHKRKYTRRNLETAYSSNHITHAWESTKLNPLIRSEDMTVSEWFALAKILKDTSL